MKNLKPALFLLIILFLHSCADSKKEYSYRIIIKDCQGEAIEFTSTSGLFLDELNGISYYSFDTNEGMVRAVLNKCSTIISIKLKK